MNVLRESERRLRAIFDTEPECVKLLAADGSLLEMNPAGLRMIEADSFPQVERRCVYPLVVEEHRAAFKALTEQVFTGESGKLEFQIVGLKGGRRWLETHASPLRDAGGKVTALLGITRDITERKQAEAAGQESRQRLQAIMDHFPGLVSAKDLQGNVIMVNRNFAVLAGPSPEEFLGKNVHELFPKDIADALWENDLAAQRAGGPVESEESVHHKDGSLHHYLTVKFPLYQAERMVATCAVSVDITGRKQDAAARALAESKYHTLFDHSPVGIYQTTPEGKFLAANAAMARILGFASPEELIGERTDIGAQGYVQPGRRAEFKRLIETHGTVTAFECEVRRKCGGTVWVSESARAVRDAAGQIVCYEGTFEDITERKQAEAAVRASGQRFRALIEHGHDGITLFGADGTILYASPSTTNLMGYSPEELLHRRALEFVRPDCQDAVRGQLAEALRQPGVGIHAEAQVRHKDGSWRFLEGTFTNLLHVPGVEGIVNNFRDVTGRQRAEQRRSAFATLGQRLNVASDATEAARIIVGVADELFGWDSCTLDLYDARKDRCAPVLNVDVFNGQRQDVAAVYADAPPSPQMRRAIEQGAELILRVEPLALTPDLVPFGDTSRPSASLMIVPVRERGRVVGVLSIQSYRLNAYTQDDLTALQDLADHCAGALKRIASEVALRASEERLQLAVHASNLGLWDWDVRTNEVVFSREWKSQLGYAEHEISNAFSEWESRVHPDDLPPALARVRQVLASAEAVYEVEFRMRHKDGSWRWIYTRAEVFRDPQGQAMRVIGCHVDITERKQAEQRQAAFAALGRRLNTATDDITAARIIANTADELFGWDSCKVDFYDAQTDRSRSVLTVDVVNGQRQELSPALSDTVPSPRLRKVVTTGALLILRQEPITLSPDSTPFGDKSRPSASIMAVPIREAGKIVGVLAIQSYRLNAYTNADLAALQALADHCAGALERIRSRANVEHQRNELALILDTVPGIIFYKDRNHRLVRVNEAHARSLGLPRSAVEGRTDSELGSPYEEEYVRDDDEVMRTGQPKLGIIEPQHTPAGTRWLQTDKLPYRDEHGNIIGVLGLALDITERKQAEDQLRERERRLSTLISNLPGAVFRVRNDPNYTAEYVSDQIAELTGYPAGDFLENRRNFGELMHPDDRERVWNETQKALGERRRYELTYRFIDAHGRERWNWERGTGIFGANGELEALEGFVLDITERRQAEEALRLAEEKFRSIFEHAVEGIYQSTPEGRYLTVNPAMAGIYGYASPEEMTREVTDIGQQIYADPEDRRRLQALLHAHGGTAVFECQTRRRDGTLIWVRQSSRAVRDASGQVVCYEGSAEDITERRQAEAVLRESEQKLRQVIDGLGPSNFVGLLSPDGTLVEANQPALAAAGLSRADVVGKPVDQTYWFAYSKAAQEQLRAAVARAAAGEPSRYDVQIRVAKGRLVWLDFSIHPLRDAGGRVLYLVPSATVIEERKHAEEALQRQHALVTAVVEGTSDAVFAKDLEGRYLIINTAGAQALGRSASEILGHTDAEFVPEATARRFRAADEAVIASGQMQSQEETGLMGGQMRSWHANKAPLRDADGRIIGVLGVSRDITDRVQAEAALRASQQSLEKAQQVGHIGSWESDPSFDGRLKWSAETARIFGFAPGEFDGRVETFLGLLHPEDRETVLRVSRAALAGERDYDLEHRIMRRDGQTRWVHEQADVERNAAGQPVRMLGVVRDITERKQVEAELVQLSGKLLRAQDEERRRLARELHDSTAQTLAALAMNLAIVGRTAAGLDEASRSLLAECEAQVKRGTTELRTFAYLLHPPALEALGLARAAQDYAEGFAKRSGIAVTLDVPDEPVRLAHEIELTLFRVLQECLGNIHRHSGSATAAIRLAVDAETAVIEVRDTGRGLGVSVLAAAQTGSARFGVGFAGMRERLRLLGGRLELEPGLPGLIVRATLPLPPNG